jgi:hypothetical protein
MHTLSKAPMSRILAPIFMALLIAPSRAAAQPGSTLVAGQKLRVVSTCLIRDGAVPQCPAPGLPVGRGSTYVGRLTALDGDTLRIQVRSNEAAVAIPTASLDRLSVIHGTKGHFWAGAGLGLLGGALIGGVIGSTQDLSGSFLFSNTNPAVLGIVIGAPAGLLLGGIIGAAIRSDRWLPVPIKDHHIQLAPRLDALGFTTTVKLGAIRLR